MQLLTTSGYKNIEDCSIGEQLIAYDIIDGHIIINTLENKEWLDSFEEGANTFYKINDNWILYCNQSIWANLQVTHVKDLQVGDVIYDEDDNDIIITSIEVVSSTGWWRLTVSGDHSFIADNLTLHNASRYWVGGGANSNWNNTVNWGAVSGGVGSQGVPTSADDVYFDGAGYRFTISSANIVKGDVYSNNGQTFTVTSDTATGVTVLASTGTGSPLASGTLTLVSGTGASTITFSSFVAVSGNSSSTISALITILDLFILSGYTATITHNAILSTRTFTLGANYTISGTAQLTVRGVPSGSVTITSNGKTWPNRLDFGTSATIASTFTFIINGNLTIGGTFVVFGRFVTINSTTSETIYCNGFNPQYDATAPARFTGTTKIELIGGTWIQAGGTVTMHLDLFINGDITISGTVDATCNLTYISGTVTTTGSVLRIYSTTAIPRSFTWNVPNVVFNTVSIPIAGTGTNEPVILTLQSDLIINNLVKTNTQVTTINKTTNEKILISRSLNNSSGNILGDVDVYLKNGTWTGDGGIGVNLYLEGNTKISGNVTKAGTSTNSLNILSSLVNASNARITFTGSQMVMGIKKIPLKGAIITAGVTLTMDEFFTGAPDNICAVSSTSTTSNYTIAFFDEFEKVSKFTAVTGCTLNKRLQLLLLTNNRFNTDRGTNIGVRYINQSPNGFPKNRILNLYGSQSGLAGGLVSDPCFTKQG